MSNVVKFTMNNVPNGLDSMYVRVEEDVLTQGVRNVLYSGVAPVSGNAIEVNIGENGVVGNGAIISADNYTSGGAAFKYMYGRSLIEAGEVPPSEYLLEGELLNIVAIGDSITAQGGGAIFNGGSVLSTYGYWVQSLQNSSQEFSIADVTAGISGDTTEDLLLRMSDILTSGADIATLLIGTNDLGKNTTPTPVQTIADNVENIIDQLIGAGMKVVLMQVTYRDPAENLNDEIDNLNLLYKGIADARVNDVVLLDKFTGFDNAIIDPAQTATVSPDMLHPNTYGAYLMSQVLTSTLDSVFLSTSPTYVNLFENQDLSQGGGTLIEATGDCPLGTTLIHADPETGFGGVLNGDGTFTIKTGSVPLPAVNDNNALLRTAQYVVDTTGHYKVGFDLFINDFSSFNEFYMYMQTGSGVVSRVNFNLPAGSVTYTGQTIWTDEILVNSAETVRLIISMEGNGMAPAICTISNPRIVKAY